MHELQTDERLAGAGDAGQQHQVARRGGRSLVRDLGDAVDGRVGRRPRPLDTRQRLAGEQVARRAYQAGEGSISVAPEKRLGREGARRGERAAPRGILRALEEETIDSLRPDHGDAIDGARRPVPPGRHEHGMHLTIGAFDVIAAQVARVAEDLIDVGLGGSLLPLQLEHDHHAILQNDDIRTARLPRQLIFQNRRVGPGRVVRIDQLAALPLQPGDRALPGADLLGSRVADELFEPQAYDAGRRAVEARQVGLPAIASFVRRSAGVGHGSLMVVGGNHSR